MNGRGRGSLRETLSQAGIRFTGAQAGRPETAGEAEAVAAMKGTKKPGTDRLLEWLLHPSERVPLALVTKFDHHLAGNSPRHALLHTIYLDRASRDALDAGEVWSPLLQAYAERVLVARIRDDDGVAVGRFQGHRPIVTPITRQELERAHLYSRPWMTGRLAEWVHTIMAQSFAADGMWQRLGEVEGGTRFGCLAWRTMATVLDEVGDNLGRLEEATRLLPSPYLWTLAGIEMRRRRTTGDPVPDERGTFRILTEAGASEHAFLDYGERVRERGKAVMPRVRSGKRRFENLFAAVLSQVAQDASAPEGDHASESMETHRRRSREEILGILVGLFRQCESEACERHDEESRKAEQSREGPNPGLPEGLSANPMVMRGVLSREEIEQVRKALVLQWSKGVEGNVTDHLEAAARMLGGELGENDLMDMLEELDGPRVSQAGRRRALEVVLTFPAATSKVALRVLEMSPKSRLRAIAARRPTWVLGDERVFEKVLASTSAETRAGLAQAMTEGEPSPRQIRRVLSRFTQADPDLTIDMLAAKASMREQLSASDIATLLATASEGSRKRLFPLLANEGT